jgi:BirA family biotin operon repressor/biotin-[acetyl-CoA-carboxylase] ligase
MAAIPLDQWAGRLEAVLGEREGPLVEVTVLRETGSTQDAARHLRAGPGRVIATGRQTAGRGRLGRSWADTGDQGIAVASAVATARAAEALLGPGRVGIKWPNDIVAGGRKLAGILVEQAGGVALIGVGMNVSQTRWPPELAGRAASLADLGAREDRIDALAALVRAMNETLGLDDRSLGREYAARDVLVGTTATFRSGPRTVTGTVTRIDPIRGLAVRTGRQGEGQEKEVFLPAAVTTVLR